MKTLKESLFDKDLVSQKVYLYHPKNEDELVRCIEKELKKQGSNANLNCIDVSKITDMSYIFYTVHGKVGNIDISEWDVSNVRWMRNMFFRCGYFNSDLSKWNVSKVENMGYMFDDCENFNSDLSKWDVSNVKDMCRMFFDCTNFNSDLSKWNVKNVSTMYSMFWGCTKFNSDLSSWNVKDTTATGDMFWRCNSLKKIPSWYENS